MGQPEFSTNTYKELAPPPYCAAGPVRNHYYHQERNEASLTTSDIELLHEDGLSSEQISKEAAEVEAALQWIPPPPSYDTVARSSVMRLRKPVAIPRVDVGSFLNPQALPFIRAYSTVLASHDVQQFDFLAFIDNIAVAQAGPAYLQALELAGMGMGFAPEPATMAAGMALQTAASIGGRVVAAVRTKLFLEKSNERYFHPRGLKVSIRKDKELAAMVGFPQDGSARVLAPIDSKAGQITIRDRRMAALAGYIAPLETRVPASNSAAAQRNVVDKIGAWQQQRMASGKEKKQMKMASSLAVKEERVERLRMHGYEDKNGTGIDYDEYLEGASDSDSSMDSLEEDLAKVEQKIHNINLKAQSELEAKGMGKAHRVEEKRQKDLKKVEHDKRKIMRDMHKKMGRACKKGRERRGKNDKKVGKMEYIVIESLY
ncbi:hypothetical protein NA57DRAFT_81670 [Rhizodiscina lignyota]|uniref:Uncharacterized protein n=1 Tax=Rhizodiscina lignyota TaxID=1504668 RepID=A0A9P4I6J5_9PEZI|nr:hypothetical protein NA57DRAFT_81670 [Rhizodiscina lignyota]